MDRKEYYLNIAKAVSENSPCLKMKVGAIIVRDDAIVSTGYNGSARGEPHCEECLRKDKLSGSEYKVCPAVHAEENAIINAARYGASVLGGYMYIYADKEKVSPCYRCERAIINAGIIRVIANE